MTWYLIVFTLHMLAAQNTPGAIQVVKFPDAQACEKARNGTSSDGVGVVCTSRQADVNGFLAGMSCRDSHMDKLPDGTEVARFFCEPTMVVPK